MGTMTTGYKRPLFAKPIRRAPPPQHAWGMIAPFAMLLEERIADIRANYAAFRARKHEREAVREQRRCATMDCAPQSSTVLQSPTT